MRLLVFSSLFPWPAEPHHGIFVLERLKAWARRTGGEAVVVAPVPYLPRALARGAWARFGEVPTEETRAGFRVLHPRHLVIPKLGMNLTPWTMARAARPLVRRLLAEGLRFDLIDAHYLYPDAVAAALLAREFQLPLVVTARGTDVNLIPRHAIPRRWLRWMLGRAQAAIVVAQALADPVRALAPPGLPIEVLRNGVDRDKFHPVDPSQARRALVESGIRWPLDRPVVLSVGHLIERKGHHHAIAALGRLAGAELCIVGGGPWRERLAGLARELGVQDRVHFLGVLPHERLHLAYSAADVLTLLSSREGWPNVLLESFACGTPVVATRVFGTPEVVRTTELGLLVDSVEPAVVARALQEVLSRGRQTSALRAFAEEHSWEPVADSLQAIFERVGVSVKARA